MALIEIEFLKNAFENTVGLVLNTGRAVPVPTLTPLGDDRLIMTFLWQGKPSIVANFPGFTPPVGTLLLRSSVVLTHASLAEIKAHPNTTGSTVTGTAWVLVSAELNRAALTMVGFDFGSGPVLLKVPYEMNSLPLPTPSNLGVLSAALVANSATVTLRFATSTLDNLLQPPTNRLLAVLAEPGASSANWLIHVPAQLYVDMVLTPLVTALSKQPSDVVIEEAPTASWIQLSSGVWGVIASAGVEKIDACPDIFGEVDMSVDITVSAQFIENLNEMRIDIPLEISTNASDWDAFRCWLGTGGIASLGLNVVPYLGIVTGIVSLVSISEEIRKQVGQEAHSITVENFTEVSRTTSTVSYLGSVPVDPLPHSVNVTFKFGPTGLNVSGNILPISPSHDSLFFPDAGALAGTWKGKINCSNRGMTHTFFSQDIVIVDQLKLLEPVGEVPVVIFSTSIAEPKGKCWIELAPSSGSNLHVHIEAPFSDMRSGDTGFVVLHTSAGLRAYTFGPLPAIPSATPGAQHLIDKFCDSLRLPLSKIEIHELKWVEPPPNYSFGQNLLRHWQIVVQDWRENTEIEVRANTFDGPLLATRSDFEQGATDAAIEIITDAQTDLVLRAPRIDTKTNFSFITRWLLPQHRKAFGAPVLALSKDSFGFTVHTVTGKQIFDLKQWQGVQISRTKASQRRKIDRQGQCLPLTPNQVAFIQDGELVIATPMNTLIREVITTN